MKSKGNKTANYHGLEVDVIREMENSSLIRYRNREFVVDTEDLEMRSSNVFARLEALKRNVLALQQLLVPSFPNTFLALRVMNQAA